MDTDRPGWNPPTGSEPVAEVPLGASTQVASAPRRSRVGTGVAVAAVGIGALGLVGTAYAATGSPSAPPSSGSESPGLTAPNGEQPAVPAAPGGDRRGGHMGGPDMGGGMGMRGAGMGIHGSFVAPKQGGGYQTIHTQRGVVTAVSDASITVKSEDGYTKKYVVTADTVVNAQRDGIGSIEVDDEVMVIGVEDGDDVTAVQIIDRTRVKDGMQRLAPPAPKASPTTGTSGSTA